MPPPLPLGYLCMVSETALVAMEMLRVCVTVDAGY